MRLQFVMNTILLVSAVCCVTPSVVSAQNWIDQTIATAELLDEVWFTDSDHGWVVGDLGTSFSTVDGGENWNSFFLTNQDLQGVAFLDVNTGLIVGDNGLVFRTTNAGVSWTPIPPVTDVNLDSVIFGTGGKAYAVGRDGTIIRSDNDGASWVVAETGTVRYRSVWASGADFAWVVGETGVIRATDDGGLNWSDQNSGTGSDLKGVIFLDPLEGWAAGQNSTLIYTADGGASWNPRAIGIQVGLDAVYFVDSNRGWAVGNLGTIYTTQNGGLNWLQEPSGTGNELNDVFFASASFGWSVGDLGTVLFRFEPTPVEDSGSGIPLPYALSPGYPNPFNPTTTLYFQLPRSMSTTVEIYDAVGRRVRTLASGHLQAGEHWFTWDGRDARGQSLPSGLYLVRLDSEEGVRTQKLVLAK